MFKIDNLLDKFKNKSDPVNSNAAQPDNAVKTVKNWYEERYDTIIVQRNLSFLLLLVLLCLSIVSVVSFYSTVCGNRYIFII